MKKVNEITETGPGKIKIEKSMDEQERPARLSVCNMALQSECKLIRYLHGGLHIVAANTVKPG